MNLLTCCCSQRSIDTLDDEIACETESDCSLPGQEGEEECGASKSLPLSKNIKVLCAEDNPMTLSLMRVFIERVFNGENIRAVFVGNGKQALNAFLGHPYEELIYRDKNWEPKRGEDLQFDLIFSDNDMPELKGSEFAKACARSGKKKPPIVLISGDDLSRENPIGVDMVFKKPLSLKQFQETVQTFLP